MNNTANHDTASDIFDRVWRCVFSKNLTTSEEYYRVFGKASTGYKHLDKQCKDEIVDTYITIEKMVEYFKKGVTVGIVRYDDVEKIYECIERHLLRWKEQFEYGVNIGDAPVEDLVDLDRFANAIYDKAKYTMTPELVDSLMVRQMARTTTLSRSTLFNKTQELESVTTGEINEDKYPVRKELGDVFKSTVIGFRRWGSLNNGH